MVCQHACRHKIRERASAYFLISACAQFNAGEASSAYQNEHKEETEREAQNMPTERLGRMHRGAAKDAGDCEVSSRQYR